MDVKIEPSWKRQLGGEFEKPYFSQLTDFVRHEYATGTCYPPGPLIFNAFNLCPFDKVKVVIIGQDPYHEEGQAQGLSFSGNDGGTLPQRQPHTVGRAGCAAAQRHPHRARTSGGEPPAQGMGRVYRRGDTRPQRPTRPPCVHTVGRICAVEKVAYRHLTPPHTRVGTPLSALRQPRRMVWQPPLLTLQPIPRRTRRATH